MTNDTSKSGPEPSRLSRPGGETIAYHQLRGEGTGLIWLGGFKSDMEGSKVLTLQEWAAASARPFTRFDYFGHGQSSGAFRDGTISRWRDDALAVLDSVTEGPQVLVGSSMGGWVASLVALARPDRIKAIVFVAPAPDFTQKLMWPSLSDEAREAITQKGEWLSPSENGFDPYPITRSLIEDGKENCLMTGSVAIQCPVRILQGMLDEDVPWRHALEFAEQIESDDVTLNLIKDGDHRLSDPANLARLVDVVETLFWEIEPERAG